MVNYFFLYIFNSNCIKREELKRWFIQHEVDMFKYKLQRVTNDPTVVERFLKENNLTYTPVFLFNCLKPFFFIFFFKN